MSNSFFPPFLSNATGQTDHTKIKLLAKVLSGYDLATTTSIVAGLLTVPKYQANAYRLETLVHIATAACEGAKKLNHQQLNTWLNRQLGVFDITSQEDPAEDAFVLNVLTPIGDFRVFSGVWESGDAATTLLIEAISKYGLDTQSKWLESALALLRVSDEIAERSQLKRWHIEPSTPWQNLNLHNAPLHKWMKRVCFSSKELTEINASPDLLKPFIFNLSDRKTLLSESNQESTLHRYPIIKINEIYIITIPSAITYAIRRYLVSRAAQADQLDTLQTALMRTAQLRINSLATHGSRHSMAAITLPDALCGVNNTCSSVALRIDRRQFIHIVLAADSLKRFESLGFYMPSTLGPQNLEYVKEHINLVQKYIESHESLDCGHTLYIAGLLGQPYLITNPHSRNNWTFTVTRLNDLELLFRDHENPVDRLILLLKHKQQLSESGLNIPFDNGILNLYSFWKEQNFQLRINEVPHNKPVTLNIPIDYVTKYRIARRRALDKHCAPLLGDQLTVVERANTDTVYESLREVPAYVSIDLLSVGILAFCIYTHNTVLWVTIKSPDNQEAKDAVFNLWEALQLLTHKTLSLLPNAVEFVGAITQITFDFSELLTLETAISEARTDTSIYAKKLDSKPVVLVRVEPGFLRRFEGTINIGEQMLAAELIHAIALLINHNIFNEQDYHAEALKVLGGTGAKILHTLRAWTGVDYLLASNDRRAYQAPTEHIESTMRSAFAWMEPPKNIASLGKARSTELLNECVIQQADRLKKLLHGFNKKALITELLHSHETLLREKQRWTATARAVRSLYGVDHGTSAARNLEGERSHTQIALRALIEAATCECPDQNGVEPDGYQLDELVGLMSTINNLGRDSDTIYFGLSSNGINLFPNGAYDMHPDVLAEIAKPFMTESFEEGYVAAAANYERWTTDEAPQHESDEDSSFESQPFFKAWIAEYGVSFDVFREILGELQDLGVKRDSVVVESTAEEIFDARANAGVRLQDVKAFIHSFGLPKRTAWFTDGKQAPSKDVYPWRFERRLSLSLRPLVMLDSGGNSFLYGVGTVRRNFSYILDSIENASFDKDVFQSKEMRAWLGSQIETLGRKFTETVASILSSEGWNVRTELKLTQIGAPKQPNLGDIDVLAWKPDGSVLVIECKRLKNSRTIAEIARACERFRGNIGDHLHKHLRRVTWIKSNTDKLAKFLKIDHKSIHIENPLVVNRSVPFKYLHGLPLPSKDIVRVSHILDYASSAALNTPHQ